MVPWRVVAVGQWTKLRNSPAGTVNLMPLLSDGTVLGLDSNGGHSYRLTPDVHGSYIQGRWVTGATPQQPRLFFSSAVVREQSGCHRKSTASGQSFAPLPAAAREPSR